MKKRVISLILAVILCSSLVCLPASAAETEPGTFEYEQIIGYQYEDAHSFSDGLAAVQKNGKWGYINTDGETVIPFEYDVAYSFSEGYAVVGTLCDESDDYYGGDYLCYEIGFIDKENNFISFADPYYFDYETGDYGNGPMTIRLSGSVSDPFTYSFHNGYICIPSFWEPEYLLYNTRGELQDFGQDYISFYGWQINEGIAITGYAYTMTGEQRYFNTVTGKYIDISGVGDGQWVNLRPFNNGIAMVALCQWDEDGWATGYWGAIDSTGKWIIEPAYSDFMVQGGNSDYIVFGETGLAMVKNADGIWGAIDKSGKTVIPFEYEALRPYRYGLAAFAKDGLYGYLNDKGEVAIPAQYVITSGFGSGGYAAAYDGEKAFIIDTKGNAIPGSDVLDPKTYFIYGDDSDIPTTFTPDEYVVVEENGLYGYGRINYVPALPEISEMHAWAYEEVVAAIKENLVPVSLRNLYLHNINREDFCTLAVCAVEEVLEMDIEDVVLQYTGKSLADWMASYPFHDTSNSDIIAANALGIINGRGNGVFDPYSSITRQEAAAMLMRTAATLGMDTSDAAGSDFKDAANIAPWAQEAVDYVFSIGVMNGTGNNNFSPRNTYTREMSYMTIYRLFVAVLEEAVN